MVGKSSLIQVNSSELRQHLLKMPLSTIDYYLNNCTLNLNHLREFLLSNELRLKMKCRY
ncbi:MAG: hypothetical protein K0S11_1804 [Gammaproteobacteria bacterium]|jgi:hypothetical protein|nr:hypothetical protein [Gammaproteobacteria bacterium]